MAGGKGKSRALPVAATPNGFNGAGPSGAGPPEDDELPPEFRVIEAPPPPEPAWEEVGARRKGRRPPLKEDGEDTKEGSGGAASGAATATRAAPGKKPATTDDQGQGGTTAARKAKAKPPSLLPIESAGSPVDHDSSNGDKGSPGTKKGKKPPKELLKAELQAKCTALLQELAKDAGYLPIEELDKAVASALVRLRVRSSTRARMPTRSRTPTRAVGPRRVFRRVPRRAATWPAPDALRTLCPTTPRHTADPPDCRPMPAAPRAGRAAVGAEAPRRARPDAQLPLALPWHRRRHCRPGGTRLSRAPA